eukprot:gene11970-biopygen22933
MHLPERTARSPWGLARRDPQRRSRSSFRQCSVIEAREDDPSAGEGVGSKRRPAPPTPAALWTGRRTHRSRRTTRRLRRQLCFALGAGAWMQ